MAGYTYEIKLRDLMSKGFKKAGANASKFYNGLKSKAAKANSHIKHNTLSINDLNSELSILRRKQSNSWNTKEIRKYGREIRRTEHRLKKLKNLPPLTMIERFRKVKSQLGGLIGLTGGLAIGLAAFGAVKGVVKLGAELEQTRISFQTMVGSVSGGNKMIADLDKFANTTPFGNADLQDSAKMLLNYGVNAQAVLPTLKRIGDISGGNKGKLEGLTRAFGQMRSMGRLTGQDLNQMINQGFNPLEEIHRTTGISQDRLRKKMRKGAISSRMVEKAFISVTKEGGRYHNMLNKQAETMGGKYSTMVGTFRSKMAKLGEAMAPVIKGVLNFGIYLANNVEVIAPFVASIGVAIAVTSKWTFVQKFLNMALIKNPIGLIIMGIGALIGAVIVIKNKTEGWAKSFRAVGVILKTSAVMMWESMKHNFSMIGFAITKLWLKFKQLGQWIGGLFKNVGNAIKLALQFDFSGAKAALSAPIRTGATQEIEELEKKKKASNTNYLKTQIENAQKIAKAKAQFGIKWKAKEVDANNKKVAALNQNAGDSVFATSNSSSSSTADSIVTGGKRSLTQNITIERVIETVNQTVNEGASEMDELVDIILDKLTRRLAGTFRSASS